MTITQLMSELKTSTDVRSKLETTLQRLRKENEIEREKTTEKERLQSRRIEQLEETVRVRLRTDMQELLQTVHTCVLRTINVLGQRRGTHQTRPGQQSREGIQYIKYKMLAQRRAPGAQC